MPEANSILLMTNQYPKAGVNEPRRQQLGGLFRRVTRDYGFESQAVFRERDQTVELNGLPQRIHGMVVTPSWFTLLRVAPELGRPFTEEEGEIGREKEVILSHGLWEQLFAGESRQLVAN